MLDVEKSPTFDDVSLSHPSRIQGKGEMAEAIRRHPWEGTELGPVSAWPPELVSAVNMMLASTVATTIQWGPEMRVFYNDVFIPNL